MGFNTFELNLFRHDLKRSNRLFIAFVGDNHDDVDGHVSDHLVALKAFCKRYKPHEVLFHLMGDYGDFCSTSERAIIKNSKLHDTTIRTLDDVASTRLKKRIKQFEFMKGRVIGVHNGNHDWHFTTGEYEGRYASEVLAESLQAKHIGYVAYSVIQMKNVIGDNCGMKMDIVSCHGKGGGKRIGAGFNTIEDMSYIFEGADIYAQGHNHQLGGIPSARLTVDLCAKTGKLIYKEKVISFIRTGSAMQGYKPGDRTYVSDSLMKPCALGFPISVIEFSRKKAKDGSRHIVKSQKTLA
jgi:hypothetical protein